jgi:hypothetical protein
MLFATPVPAHCVNNLHTDLDGPFATKVVAACFRSGEEDENEIDFFRLWGRVVRREYKGRTTMYEFGFVEGEALEIFNALYGEAV